MMLPNNTTEQEKSLSLAELMGWEDRRDASGCPVRVLGKWDVESLIPYDKCKVGLAQFAEILLKFPEVMLSFCHIDSVEGKDVIEFDKLNATQASILDELLRSNRGIQNDDK